MTSEFRAAHSLALLVVLAVVVSPAPPAFGQSPMQTYTYQVLIDSDHNDSTGCSVIPTGGTTLSGYEHRLRVTVEPTADNSQTTAVARQDCDGAVFGPPAPVTQPASPPWPIALNAGLSGADAIELAVRLGNALPAFTPAVRLAFVADNDGGSDVLATIDGSAAGSPITFVLPSESIAIPVLSLGGLVVLLLAVLVIGALAHRRLGRFGAVSMVLLLAGLAWAMHFAPDGNLGDWSSLPPAGQDPRGDSSNGDAGNDLVAGFAATENGTLFFRIDVRELENRIPGAEPDSYSTDEDTPLNVAPPGVLDNDADPDADPITAVLGTGPAHAASFTLDADGGFDYVAQPNFNGSDRFTYRASDGQADSAVTTVTITVDAANDAPAADNGSATTDEDVPVTIALTGSDVDGDALTFAIGTAPSNGSLSAITQLTPTSAEVTYTPSADFNGADAFTFTVNDTSVDSDPATVAITVDAVNDAPAAADGTATTDEDTSVVIPLTGSDVEGDGLTFSIATGPSNGSLGAITQLTPTTAEVTYTPNANFNGNDAFTFTVNDSSVDSDPATFAITVSPVADPPTITAIDDQVIDEDGTTGALAFAVGDPDTPVDSLDIVASSSTPTLLPDANLNLAGSGMNRTITATPAANQNGSATITLTVTDAETPPMSTTFEVTVTAVNDPPRNSLPSDQTVLENQVLNFSSANGNAISISDVDAATGEIVTTLSVDAGTLQATAAGGSALIGNGTDTLTVTGPLAEINATLDGVSYQGPADAGASATLTITTNDQGNTGEGGPLTDTDTADISVLPVNERPSIHLDGATVVGPGDVGIEGTASYSLDPATDTELAYAFGDPEGNTDCSGNPCFDDLWYEIRFVSAPETPDGDEPFTYLSPFDRSENIDVKEVVIPDSANGDLGYIQWQSNLELANEVLDNFRIRLNEPGLYVMEIIVLDSGRSGTCPDGIEIPSPDPSLDPDGIRSTVGRNGDLIGGDQVRCLRESSVRITFDATGAASTTPTITFVAEALLR